MREDSFLANDLEILKIAAREARLGHAKVHVSNPNANRTDIVHAGYRFLQCGAAAMVFIYHLLVDLTQEIPDIWDFTFIVIYPCCFVASLILAVTRLMNFIPNPTPIIPVAISVTGWLAMLAGGVLAMRHAQLTLHVDTMTDEELASSPIFQHDSILCAMSLLGSTLYLVHAWLCYDCWQWEKRESKMKATVDTPKTSSSDSESESDSGMSSNDDTEPISYQPGGTALALPGTSSDQDKSRQSGYRKFSVKASKLLNKLKKQPKTISQDESNDPFATLNEILSSSVHVEQTKVEDEPVRLYCCCVDIGNIIKNEYMTKEPVHEFQVVHVM